MMMKTTTRKSRLHPLNTKLDLRFCIFFVWTIEINIQRRCDDHYARIAASSCLSNAMTSSPKDEKTTNARQQRLDREDNGCTMKKVHCTTSMIEKISRLVEIQYLPTPVGRTWCDWCGVYQQMNINFSVMPLCSIQLTADYSSLFLVHRRQTIVMTTNRWISRALNEKSRLKSSQFSLFCVLHCTHSTDTLPAGERRELFVTWDIQ